MKSKTLFFEKHVIPMGIRVAPGHDPIQTLVAGYKSEGQIKKAQVMQVTEAMAKRIDKTPIEAIDLIAEDQHEIITIFCKIC